MTRQQPTQQHQEGSEPITQELLLRGWIAASVAIFVNLQYS
jgi:hypothetical protein